MEFKEQSVLIKDISKLNLRSEVVRHAQKLIELVEFPVVFWVNAETDKNYAMQHQKNPNQFWISIKAGTTEKEKERLILAGLFRQVQFRKRYAIAKPNKKYLLDLQTRHDNAAILRLSDLLGEINSFSSTLECEFYLEQFGISTEEEVKQKKFKHYREGLIEYLDIQKSQPFFRWHPENEASNLIGFASCCRFDQSYQRWFLDNILLTKPKERALWYQSVLVQFEKLVHETRTLYNGENGELIVNRMREQMVDILHAETMVSVGVSDVYSYVADVKGRKIKIYSFIPEDFSDGIFVMKVVRYVNESLGLFREFVNFDAQYPYAKVAISYEHENNISTFVDEHGQYYVLLYVDFLKRLEEIVNNFNLGEKAAYIEKMKGKEYVRGMLFRYTLMYMTLHEYGHIFNGDCDCLEEECCKERMQKENMADAFADRHFRVILQFQYRQSSFQEYLTHMIEDDVFAVCARKIALMTRQSKVVME